MALVTTETTWPTDMDHVSPGVGALAEDAKDIVIVNLDHSMAYAVPTWCASSPRAETELDQDPFPQNSHVAA